MRRNTFVMSLTKIRIMKNIIKHAMLAVAMIACLTASFPAQSQDKPKKGYASVNGIKLYYEISGTGKPLLVLHGGLMSMDMFTPFLPALTAGRQVIAVDLYGHGRTALTDRPLSLVDMGNDLAALIKELGYSKVDVLGYSMGSGAGLRLAIQHPEVVNRLALVSVGFAREGFYPEILTQQQQVNASVADMMKETPMYQAYAAVAPKPGDFPKLLDRMGEMMAKSYNWSEEIKKLKMPVMLAYGDADMFRPEHMVEFYQLLGGGQKDAGWMREHMSQNRLAILPNHTHYDMFATPEIIQTVLPFLDGKMEPQPQQGH